MVTLHIHSSTGDQILTVQEGLSVRDALDTTELRVRAACGGTGSCGVCAIRLLGGTTNSPTPAEYMKLSPEDRLAGKRLACQLRLLGNTEILLDHPAPHSDWKSILPENLLPVEGANHELNRHIYGIAVDLGTTHIRVAFWDRKRGKRLATRHGLNPQNIFGADVLNRLTVIQRNPERTNELAALARSAIIKAVRDILTRDIGSVAPILAEIGKIIIVGNTAMLALLTEQGGETLIDPDNWQQPIDCHPTDAVSWLSKWHMPNAEIILPAPLAGFIGSDLLADLIATNFTRGPAGSLLLDVGTNTEIALWDGRRLHVTSVPGGPAFEGGYIRYGMPAETGAIYRVRRDGEHLDYEVIGGGQAKGICGSGLVSAIAVLLATGRLKPSGRFTIPNHGQGLALDPSNTRTVISSYDVDTFQRAKAATAAAMAELLELAGLRWTDVRRLCVCGAFGNTLDIEHAQQVGLLPAIDPQKIELFAEASLMGCERALLSSHGEHLFSAVSGKTSTYNLSFIDAYEERFINHLRLSPLPSVR